MDAKFSYDKQKLKKQKEQRNIKGQLCWSCKRAVPKKGCEWADSFKPVKGWIAKPTKLKLREGHYIDSYAVISCPKYINDHDKKAVL